MKSLGAANGRMIALFRFEPGHAYAAEAGTRHEQFSTEGGATLVSVFQIPG